MFAICVMLEARGRTLSPSLSLSEQAAAEAFMAATDWLELSECGGTMCPSFRAGTISGRLIGSREDNEISHVMSVFRTQQSIST
eukprot:1195101-Prorocentrum_minimum.AAC.11